MIKRAFVLMLLASAPAPATPLRDATSYAIASCLGQQPEAFLKSQADGWGSIVMNRSRLELDRLFAVRSAVLAEMKRRPMYVVHGDRPVAVGDPRMPVAYCVEIADAPQVRAAIAQAVRPVGQR